MPIELQLPVSRIVWGHPMKAQKKTDQQTRKPILRADGTTIDQWVCGVAIPEQDFVQKVWPAMDAEAKSGFPQGIPPQFSFKYKAGSGTDRQGKPYASREGYAGHYVLTIATEAFCPSVFKYENGSYRQLEAHEIKCGDYVVPTVSLQVNVPANKTHTPGLYVNPRGFLLVGYGKEIVNAGADPTQLFGQQPQQFALPPGASYQPMMPTNTAPPYGAPPPGTGLHGQPTHPGAYAPPQNGPPITTGPQPYQPPGMGQPPPMGAPPNPGYPPAGAPGNPAYAPQPGPGPGYPPAHDFVHNAGQQQPGYPPQGQQPGYPPQGQQPSYPPQSGPGPSYGPR